MEVLVAYASKHGSTKGIAEFIGGRLSALGLQADVKDVKSVSEPAGYGAYVVGSAVYMFHWMKEAKQFLSRNRTLLSSRPVWMFSSGPVGPSRTNLKGEDLLDVSVSGPKEIGGLQEAVRARDHKIFFGALDGSKLTGATGFMYRAARRSEAARQSMPEGDFRDWKEIEAWADSIALVLKPAPSP